MVIIKRFDPLKFARTEKPQETPKVKTSANIASAKGPQKKQNFFRRLTKQEKAASKRPTERGETLPRGRVHHCIPNVLKTTRSLATTVPNVRLGKRKKRAKRPRQRSREERVKKEDENKWFRDHYERKKPGSEVVDQAVTEAHIGPV
ncbi:MAG: hypothetical protein Q9207_006521 [Kuettlingeria erythrocarpa]